MIVPHPFDIVAILLGIFLALRRTDIRAEDPQRHPRVSLQDFERWRREMLAAYSIGTRACFAKVLVDFAFMAYLQRNSLDLALTRGIGVSLDAAWILALGWCFVARRRARRYGDSIGIQLTPGTTVPPDAESTPPRK